MEISDTVMEALFEYSGRIILIFIALILGKWLINRVLNLVDKRASKDLDETLHSFSVSFLKIVLYLILAIIIASTLGFEMSSLIALISVAGLSIGFALQGSLANFAGGILILVFRPFCVGDFIEAKEHKGKVKSIHVLYTTLNTRDNKTVVIPNGTLANNSMINYTENKTRRVELSIGISYEDDIREAKKVMQEIVDKHDLILTEPEPIIRVAEHADSSINFNVFVWAENKDYWSVYYDLLEEIKIVFDEQGITFPYPQMDVHLEQ